MQLCFRLFQRNDELTGWASIRERDLRVLMNRNAGLAPVDGQRRSPFAGRCHQSFGSFQNGARFASQLVEGDDGDHGCRSQRNEDADNVGPHRKDVAVVRQEAEVEQREDQDRLPFA